MDIICNHCGCMILEEDLELDDDNCKLNEKIGNANRLIGCYNCQFEVFFNGKTFEVVVYKDAMRTLNSDFKEKIIENIKED